MVSLLHGLEKLELMMNNTYKNIKYFIFDFGNVLYEVQHNNMIYGLAKLSGNNLIQTANRKELMSDVIYDKFEKGEISRIDFLNYLKNKFEIKASNDEIIEVWDTCLIGLYDFSYNAILEFKKFGKVALLSNTDEIHHEYFSRQCVDFFKLFDKLYFSHLIHKRKPDLDIYEYVLENSGFLAEETLFIDDLEANIDAARKVGMNTYWINKDFSILDLLYFF